MGEGPIIGKEVRRVVEGGHHLVILMGEDQIIVKDRPGEGARHVVEGGRHLLISTDKDQTIVKDRQETMDSPQTPMSG